MNPQQPVTRTLLILTVILISLPVSAAFIPGTTQASENTQATGYPEPPFRASGVGGRVSGYGDRAFQSASLRPSAAGRARAGDCRTVHKTPPIGPAVRPRKPPAKTTPRNGRPQTSSRPGRRADRKRNAPRSAPATVPKGRRASLPHRPEQQRRIGPPGWSEARSRHHQAPCDPRYHPGRGSRRSGSQPDSVRSETDPRQAESLTYVKIGPESTLRARSLLLIEMVAGLGLGHAVVEDVGPMDVAVAVDAGAER